MPATVRAALYLRVSTGRQADSDLSIPDQRRQAKCYCAPRGWEIVADYVEPGASATDDRRPEFQRMIDAATVKPPAFDVILVHSFSRFFRDQFRLEFYVRRLAKNGVRLVSITQELGDDPMSNMIRQIMALFDEYQSKENAKHTLRAMKENARQGFWNGALPPIGYRVVEAAEQRGHRTKKTLEIDPIQAETVRLIYRLAREGNGSSGSMGVKSIAKHLNESGIRTRDGGRWGVDAVHKVLTRTTYIGRHRFNTKHWNARAQTGGRDRRNGGAADHRRGRVRSGADAAQVALPGANRAARRQRTDPPYRHLLLRYVRWGNDTKDRKEREIQVLHLFDQGPAGRDRLQGPHRSDGKAR
jgi:site-specific DNA recombinase